MSTTLGEQVTEVSIILGDQTVGEYFPATEIKRAIGDTCRFYVMKLIRGGEGYFETTTTLDIVNGQEYISLAGLTPPFLACSVIWRKLTTGYKPMKKNEQRFKFQSTIGIGAGDTYIPEYRFRGTNLILTPSPISSETAGLKLDYVYMPTFPTRLSLDAFTFDANFPEMFELNVKLRAAIKLLESKDATGGVSDIASLRTELAQADEAMEDTLTKDESPDTVEYQGIDYNTNLT